MRPCTDVPFTRCACVRRVVNDGDPSTDINEMTLMNKKRDRHDRVSEERLHRCGTGRSTCHLMFKYLEMYGQQVKLVLLENVPAMVASLLSILGDA